jgi:hypothetical protein
MAAWNTMQTEEINIFDFEQMLANDMAVMQQE